MDVPPSSPPALASPARTSQPWTGHAAGRKRNHEAMNSQAARGSRSGSPTPSSEGTRSATPTQGKSSQKPTPPPAYASQDPSAKRPDDDESTENGRPLPEQQAPQTHASSPEEEEEDDPHEPIEQFDWKGLEQRYHDYVKRKEQEETRLQQDSERLAAFFRVWSETPKRYEVDRSFKRLRTRMMHVQHSEELLEQKRQHYQRVVRAFESALDLLNGP